MSQAIHNNYHQSIMNEKTIDSRYETPHALRHDAAILAEEARALLDATAAVTDEKVAQARQRLTAALESGRQTYASLQEKALEGGKVADQAVRSHPYETLAIAFGVGAVLGCMLSRRN